MTTEQTLTPANQEANTIVDNQTTPNVAGASENTSNPDTSLFDSMVGAGKKFKDANSLAFGKLTADQHIDNLTTELKELRERNALLESENAKKRDLEEILAEIKQAKETNGSMYTTPSGVETQPAVDLDAVVAKVKDAFDAETKAEKARSNAIEVEEALRKHYGESYQTIVKEKAKDLGLPLDVLISTMANSPKAALTLLGVAPSKSVAGAAPSTINTSATSGQATNARQARIAEIQAIKQRNFQEYLGLQGELNRLLVQERMGG